MSVFYLHLRLKQLGIIFLITQCLIFGNFVSATAQAPTITSVSPATVCQGSGVTITGTNFTGATSVNTAGTPVISFKVVNSTTITATISDQSGSGAISVTTPEGTFTSSNILTVLPTPQPSLTDISTLDLPFTNCDGNSTYTLTVENGSTFAGGSCDYDIDWGDNSTHFKQPNWVIGLQTSHTYRSQGYFDLRITITPANGCTKEKLINFYNGANPLANFSTLNPTTSMCADTIVTFTIGDWFKNTPGTYYNIKFGDGSDTTLPHPLNKADTVQWIPHKYTKSSCPNQDFIAVLDAINGCYTKEYTQNQIVVRIKPIADFNFAPATPCLNNAVCFTNLTVNGYSGTSCSTNTSYAWDFGDGSTIETAATVCHTYSKPGTYNVKLSSSNTACGEDSKTKTITVQPVSPPPTVSATPATYCQGEPAIPLTATGTGLLWYSTLTGGNGSPTAPTPPTNKGGTFIYYVSQTLINNCESERVPLTVIVNVAPLAPGVTSPLQLCQNQAATPLTASGTGLLWYNTPTGSTGSSTPPTPSTTATGNATYYVSQTVNGCEGPRASIVVTVNSVTGAPAVTSPVIYCQNEAASPLTATGTSLLWYTTATGGTGSSTAPVPSTALVDSTTYYVSQATGCGEGPRDSIMVIVKASPSAAIGYSITSLCNVMNSASTPNPPVNVALTGTTGGVYTISPSSGLSIDAATGTLNPSGATAGNYTIKYTIAGTGGCSDFTTAATVNVNGSPTATISYPAALCTLTAPTNVTLTGSQGGAFSSFSGLTIDKVTGTITPASSTPGTYGVTYTIPPSAPCPGFTTTTSVVITEAPSATIAYGIPNLCNVLNSDSIPNRPVDVILKGTSGGNYTISPSTGLTINATTGTLTPSGAQAGNYTITYTIPGTGGCADFTATATVRVNSSPAAVISYPATVCTSTPPTNATLTGTQGGVFSSSTGLTIDAATGVITPATSTPGTYTVTYTVSPSAPCSGFVTTTSITITKAALATIVYTPSILCTITNTPATPNPPVNVTLTGTQGGSYTISPLTGLPIDPASGTIAPSGALPGTYTITYTIPGAGGCPDYSITATVTVSGATTATINYPGSPYCQGITTPQQVAVSGTAGGSFTSTPGLSVNATTGAINPSLSTPGTYTVTYTISPTPPCPAYATVATVEIDESPVLTFPVSAQSICSGGTAVFAPSSTVANTNYAWSVAGTLPANVSGVTSGTSSGPNPISLSFINTGETTQSITIQVVPTSRSRNPCAGVAYNLTLTINPIPPLLQADTVNFCTGTPATPLTANPLPGNSLKWYDVNLVLLSQAPAVSTSTPAEFTYYVSQVTNSGCESAASKITVIVHPTTKIISSAFTNPTTCGIPSGTIVLHVLDLNNNAIPDYPVIVHYEKFQTAYSIAESTDASGKITIPLAAGTYSGIYVETGGCNSQKIPDVYALTDPDPPAKPVAGYNPPICSETPLNLSASSATSSQTGPVDYVWVGPAFGPLPDTSRNTVVTFPSAKVSDEGTYIVYAIQNNCISPEASFQVSVKQSPLKPQISTRTPLCTGEALVLQASSSIPGNASLTYLWTGPGRGFPVNAANAEIINVTVQDAGVYTITVSSPETGCSATRDTLIRVGGYPDVKFAQDSLTLPTGYLLQLTPVITNAGEPNILPVKTFEWTPSKDIDCNDPACSSPVTKIRNDGCFTVKATNIYGCSGSSTICVKTFCEGSQVFIPNAFVPHGGLPENAKFMIRASGIASVKSFRIFNRWGKLLFEKNNFPPNNPAYGWDGSVNGKPVDVGVYIYTTEVICENGTPYVFKGNVTLL